MALNSCRDFSSALLGGGVAEPHLGRIAHIDVVSNVVVLGRLIDTLQIQKVSFFISIRP
jgi:hypothetical protein